MIELTQAQRQELELAQPIVQTNTSYVLVRKDIFERIRGLVGDEGWTEDAYQAAMEVFARDGWDDPRMDVYDELDPPTYLMNVQRGDVVLVDFPYAGGVGSKVRPALVIQNDRDNVRLVNTIVAQITGTTHRALEATQVLIDVSIPQGQQSGLRFDSVVNSVNLVTLDKTKVLRRLGNLPVVLLLKVNDALKTALELP